VEEVSCESRDPRLTFHHLSRRKPCKVTESRLPLQKNHSRDVLKYKLRNGADDVEPPRERNNSRDKNTKKVLPCRGTGVKESLCTMKLNSDFFMRRNEKLFIKRSSWNL